MPGDRRRAFTLIELLIVVAIIAILAAIAVPNFLEAQTRAKVSRVKSDLRSINMGLATYRVDYNQIPMFKSKKDSGDSYPNFLMVEGKNAGGPHEGRCLTTPLAYLTTIPMDIF